MKLMRLKVGHVDGWLVDLVDCCQQTICTNTFNKRILVGLSSEILLTDFRAHESEKFLGVLAIYTRRIPAPATITRLPAHRRSDDNYRHRRHHLLLAGTSGDRVIVDKPDIYLTGSSGCNPRRVFGVDAWFIGLHAFKPLGCLFLSLQHSHGRHHHLE